MLNIFRGCVNLSSVYITDLTAWCNISFSGSNSNPFHYEDEQRIPHHLYLNGQEITDLVIPEGITSIGDYAFAGCIGLTSVTIPSSVTSLNFTSFYNCNNLTDVYCLAESVPQVYVNINPNVTEPVDVYWKDMENATLHVPASALNAYKCANLWSDFGNIVALTEDEIDGINEVESSKLKVESSDGKWYDLSGRQIVNSKSSNSKLSPGINIIRMSGGTTKKVLVK